MFVNTALLGEDSLHSGCVLSLVRCTLRGVTSNAHIEVARDATPHGLALLNILVARVANLHVLRRVVLERVTFVALSTMRHHEES